MKVLFDTNVYVSETLVGFLSTQIVEASVRARWRIFVSEHLLGEVERVLTDKLGYGKRLGKLARRRCLRRAELVHETSSRHEVPGDVNDSPILCAAVLAGVDYLVSDDRHLLRLHPYEGIQILSMQDFAALLRNRGILE